MFHGVLGTLAAKTVSAILTFCLSMPVHAHCLPSAVGAPLKSGPTPKADAPLELQLPDLPDFSNAGDALNKAAAGAQEAASQLTGNITGAFSNLANSMTGGVSGLQGSVNGGLSGIKGSVTGGISGIQGSVTEGISGITGVVSSSTNGATRQLTDAVSGTTAGVAALVDENTQVRSCRVLQQIPLKTVTARLGCMAHGCIGCWAQGLFLLEVVACCQGT